MSALTKPTPFVPALGNLRDFQQAAVNILQGGIVGRDPATGYAKKWILGYPFEGHAMRSSDNSLGAAGDKRIEVLQGRYLGEISLPNVTITDASRQAAVFAQDDGTYSLRSGQMVARVIQYVSSGKALVEFDTSLQIHCLAETILRADMTDGGGTSGYKDFATSIPAGSLVIGNQFDVRTAFVGDTSAVIDVGISGNTNNFTALSTVSVFTTGVRGVQGPGATDNTYLGSATAPRVTITSDSDFTNVSAGEVDVRILYLPQLRQ